MTQPTNPPVIEGNDAHESQQNGNPQLATGAQARLDEEQQIAWLRNSTEVFRAPGTSKKTIGLSALAIGVSGLAVAAMAHILAPGPVSSEVMAPPTAARPQARPATSSVLATNPSPTVPPAPLATNVTSSTAPGAPVSPASPALAPAAPKPEQHVPIAGGTTERRSNSRHKPLASPPSPAPALPEMTAARWPSSDNGDQDDRAQGAPPPPPSQDQQDRRGQQSQWHWQKTTTCDSSGRCVDHYNPAPSNQ
jgi:hypothetical protein